MFIAKSLLTKVKVGIVGCGYWGPKLARNLHAIAEADFSIACDLREERLEQIHHLYPETVTTRDFQDLLDSDLDAIVIATPVKTHYPLAKAALAAGKHVLIEKPMTASSRQAEELINIAHKNDLVLLVGHTYEYNPAVEAIKQIIASGELGEIHYIDSIRGNLGLFRSDINVIWDLATHDLSILLYILNLDPLSMSAHGKTCIQRHKGLHDVATLTLYFPEDVLVTIRVSWLEPIKTRRLTIVGSHKMLVYDDTAEDKLVVYYRGVSIPESEPTESETEICYRQGETKIYPLTWDEPLNTEIQHFIDCVHGKTQAKSNGKVGLKVVKLLEAADYSLLNNGMKIPIDFLDRVCI